MPDNTRGQCSDNWFVLIINISGVGHRVLVQGRLQGWLLWEENSGWPVPDVASSGQFHNRSTTGQSWTISQVGGGSVKTYLSKGRQWERREQSEKQDREHRRRRRCSMMKQAHTSIPPKELRLLKDPCQSRYPPWRDNRPHRSYVRAGTSQETLGPADEPMLQLVLL